MGHRHIYTEHPRGKAKTAAIQAAREKLAAEERQAIDSLARYCARRAKVHGAKKFGAAAGLELPGKPAMLLEERLDA
jgi:uncharacterized protein involved in exopolysaccharide biosynthesis